jgi:hypothetical protein
MSKALLDPTDENLDFVTKRDTNPKPIAIFRVKEGEFFLCYNGKFLSTCSPIFNKNLKHWIKNTDSLSTNLEGDIKMIS